MIWMQNILYGVMNFQNTSGLKLTGSFVSSFFEISALQLPKDYTPDKWGDVLNTKVHQNVQLSEVTVFGIRDSDHKPVMFGTLDHVWTMQILDHVEEMTSWKLSKHLAFELVLQIKINTSEEANKETHGICNFCI